MHAKGSMIVPWLLRSSITSKTLNKCRYLPDIDIETPAQSSQAGLPPTCMIWPNTGDQLAFVSKTPGLHSPLTYVAGDEFVAVFNCHREDFDLHSINFLKTPCAKLSQSALGKQSNGENSHLLRYMHQRQSSGEHSHLLSFAEFACATYLSKLRS